MSEDPLRLRRVVLLGAMPEEIAVYRDRLQDGRWHGVEVALGLTGVGKPAAAAATQAMIDRHRPDAVLFTGVAGALVRTLRIGDVVVGVAAIDADLDIRAWMPALRRGEPPFGGPRLLCSDPRLAACALATPIGRIGPGYIATGSAFLDGPGKARFIAEVLPDLEAEIDGVPRRPDLIEMEGSAVLQTAQANRVPALAVRAVSDALEGDAVEDFNRFLGEAADRAAQVVGQVLRRFGPTAS